MGSIRGIGNGRERTTAEPFVQGMTLSPNEIGVPNETVPTNNHEKSTYSLNLRNGLFIATTKTPATCEFA